MMHIMQSLLQFWRIIPPSASSTSLRCQMYKFLIITFFLSAIFSNVCQAQEQMNTTTTPKRPKICLALSGGGARGFAHVGVLKKLEELHIPIDCIAGTSMGSVVGGLYAAGLSANEIEKRLEALKLTDIALDRVDRRNVPQALREEDAQYPLGATLGLSENGVRLPSGAVQATQFLELLQNWTAHLQPDVEFDHLPIPFRTVATDLETGKMVVFTHGPLHMAIRASMAAPGVFAPIEVDGRLLADGGLVRNLPVDIAREMGADIVIAVNIGTPLLPRDQLSTFFNVSQQMLNILTEQNVEAQKAILHSGDILIQPNLGNISFMDFGRLQEASVIGEKAAEAMRPRLASLSLNEESYLAQQKAHQQTKLSGIKIGFVEIKSNGAIPVADLRRQLAIAQGTKYDAEEINKKIARLNITREYDSINHELVERDGQYGIVINAIGRNWGPHFLRFGLALSSGFEGTGGFNLQIGHRRPWLTDSGLEWRNDLEFGNSIKLRSELRQPLFEREGMYFAPSAEISQNTRNLYSGDLRIAEYKFRRDQVGLDLAFPLGEQSTLGESRIGFMTNHYRIRPKLGGFIVTAPDGSTSTQPLPDADLQQLGLKTSLVLDQLSDPSFPRYGYKVDSNLFLGVNKTSHNYQEVAVNGVWANSYNNHSINVKLSAAGLFQSDTQLRGIGSTLGGFQKLSAYQPDQFSGNYMAYGSVTYLLRAVKFDLAGQSLFLGTSFEAGNVWNSRAEMSLGSLRKSASVFAGFSSFMGPIYVGVAIGQTGAKNVFFQLGRQ